MGRGDSVILSAFRDSTTYFCYALLVATGGPFQFGFHLAELNAPQDVITCKKKRISSTNLQPTLPQCIRMDTDLFALVSSIYTLGGLLGALSAAPCCNFAGRLLSMRLSSIFFICGPVFESLAGNVEILSFGRFVSGIGAGLAIVVVPIYISEIAPPREKGLFGAFTQVMINLGILTAQLLGYFLSRDNLWRIILATAGGVGLLQLAGLLFVPESPKWLAQHNNPRRARIILGYLRGYGADLEAELKTWGPDSSAGDVSEEEGLIHSPSGPRPSLDRRAVSSPIGIFGAITHPIYRRAIIAVIAATVAQQFTGINSIVMYSVNILSALLPTTAALITVLVSALNVVISILCTPLSDRFGRKTCLLLSIAGMGINSILLAVGISHGFRILSALATLFFVACFAVGLGPIPFILPNELVGPEAVSVTQSWGLAASWIATFLVSQFFPMINKALGGRGRVYYLFAGFATLFGAFIAWWVPETKGKQSAEEVWGRREARQRSRTE